MWKIAVSLVLSATLGGCISMSARGYSTPVSVDPTLDQPYPLDVNYEILGVGRGEACADVPRGPGQGVQSASSVASGIYEEAKFNAIESVTNADNLMFIRTQTSTIGDRVCVKVIGRGYRVVHVHARGGATDELSAAPVVPAPLTATPVPAPPVTDKSGGKGGR